jgi:superfamily I DNA and/or RNA helicase
VATRPPGSAATGSSLSIAWSSGGLARRASIGIITLHRAQRAAVVSLLQRVLRPAGVPADLIGDAVDTVERFQGGERDLILISFGLGDPDLIQHEEEFLFQKERINVAVTRAKAKVVLFVTRDLSYHGAIPAARWPSAVRLRVVRHGRSAPY